MTRLAESILTVLAHHQVDTVFGIPGNHNVELYRYLPASGIRHVTTRHEQGAGFMADGYARASGAPGVCFLISGPGLTNAMTAMAQALADSVPMVVIATVGDQTSRQGRLHELPDQLALAQGVCVDAVQPADPADALVWLDGALFAHTHSRPGPRYMQIPLSWWQLEIAPSARLVPPSPQIDVNALTAAVDMLEESARPLMLIGGGAQNAAVQVQTLAEALAAPVVNTVNAKGVMPHTHLLAVGGSPSLQPVRDLIERADLLLAVGTELGETDYDLIMQGDMHWTVPMIRIDIDPDQACLNVTPAVSLVGGAQPILTALLARLPTQQRKPWVELAKTAQDLREHAHMHPEFAELFALIDDTCPDAVVVGDSTRPTYYASWMWHRPAPRRYFHSVSGYGTLGYAVPAALGAKVAARARPVLCLIGDGGALFTLGELAVAVQENLPIKILLWDNSGYQEIAHSMAARGIDTAVTQYDSPDFAAIAAGFGVAVSCPANWAELRQALQQSADGPQLIHLREAVFISQPSGEWY